MASSPAAGVERRQGQGRQPGPTPLLLAAPALTAAATTGLTSAAGREEREGGRGEGRVEGKTGKAYASIVVSEFVRHHLQLNGHLSHLHCAGLFSDLVSKSITVSLGFSST